MKQNREQEILARLSLVQKLTLSEAMELLQISESTARRIFARLEQDGRAIRTHGGLQSLTHAIAAYSFEDGEKINIDKKTAIAREACKLLDAGEYSVTQISTLLSYSNPYNFSRTFKKLVGISPSQYQKQSK